MTADDEAKLRHYCAGNFAASAVFVDSPDERTDGAPAGGAEIVWLATRDRTRAATSHRRSARAVLAKLRIPTTGLQGTWLVLAADEAVRAAAAEHRVARQMQSFAKRRAQSKAWSRTELPVMWPMITPRFEAPARLAKQPQRKP